MLLASNLYRNKRNVVFFLTTDSTRKQNYVKSLTKHYFKLYCNITPERLNDSLFLPNKYYNLIKFDEYLDKEKYIRNNKAFQSNKPNANSIPSNMKPNEKYDPIDELTKSIKMVDIQYTKMEPYFYFSNFQKFLSSFETHKGNGKSLSKMNDTSESFIECLCRLYIGQIIHCRIQNEISVKTNINILKGDYFFSLGYLKVSQLGNPKVVKLYSKISENFAKSIFDIDGDGGSSHTSEVYFNKNDFLEKIMERFVGYIFYGCNALKELMNINNEAIRESLNEISFKYGLLIYLKEELESFNESSHKFFYKIDDLLSSFLIYIQDDKTKKELLKMKEESQTKDKMKKGNDNSEIHSIIQKQFQEKRNLEKYKIFAFNMILQINEQIDKINLTFAIPKHSDSVSSPLNEGEEFKKYLYELYTQIEKLTA